jgi:hypothetical protein
MKWLLKHKQQPAFPAFDMGNLPTAFALLHGLTLEAELAGFATIADKDRFFDTLANTLNDMASRLWAEQLR